MQEGNKGVEFQVFHSVACMLLKDLATQGRVPMWDHLEEGVEVHFVPLLFTPRYLCSLQEDRLTASQVDPQSEAISTDLGFIIGDVFWDTGTLKAAEGTLELWPSRDYLHRHKNIRSHEPGQGVKTWGGSMVEVRGAKDEATKRTEASMQPRQRLQACLGV